MNSWIVVIISLLCSAFFSGMEIAFISANKLKIELDNKAGLFYARIFSYFIKKSSRFIGAMLVGNNISLVIYGITMATILEPIMRSFLPEQLSEDFTILIIQTILSTLIILVTAEFLPKVLFSINPNQAIRFFSYPAWIAYIILYPTVFITVGLSEKILEKIFNKNFSTLDPQFGRIDLENYIDEVTSNHDDKHDLEHEFQIFQNALDFSSIKLRECLIPRTEITALDVKESVEVLRKKFIETRLSRIPIYKDSIENIIGYAHSHDMFKEPKTISSILLSIPIVPETMHASKLLTTFIQQKKSIAVVVDEFGGTSGMITMEDVIEEIFGEINDEHDTEDHIEKQINEHEFIFSGRLEIDYINEKYYLEIPKSDEYETLAGFIILHHESIPKLNEEITISPFHFKILQVSDIKIEQVKLQKIGN